VRATPGQTGPLPVYCCCWTASSGTRPGVVCRLKKFSNRCFPTKAVEIWHRLNDAGHTKLVEGYLKEAGNFDNLRSLDRSPRRMFSDPLYAVVGESTGPYAGGRAG
jgi:hypothetical protein